MQVQLIVANENRKGQTIPVNVPAFMIGRAEGCNLRSRSPQVSRNHCIIRINNSTVVIQDLGGENGTFVNGSQVSSSQELKDGDKLIVGTHAFIVSIKAGTEKPGGNPGDFFELTSGIAGQPKQEQSDTSPIDPNMVTGIIPSAKKLAQEAEIMFEVRLDGQRLSVTKSRLFDLAQKGSILPDDLVTVAGTKVFADSIQGIVFGEKSEKSAVASPTPPPPSTGSATQSPPPFTTATSSAPSSDLLALPDFGGSDESSPFDHIINEPFVRVARKESAFSAIWKALDISFSRVYALEGNNLAIHSVKALYYVLVVTGFLFMFKTFVNFGLAWSESGIFLQELQKHYMGMASATFGSVTIIVVVRVLLEMLLLAWFESAQEEQEKKEE